MRIFAASCLLLASLSASASAAVATEDDAEKFKQAYAAYQKYSEQGDYEKSLPEAKTAYEIGLKYFGDDHPNQAALTYNYGLNLLDVRNHEEEARKILKEALTRYERVNGKDAAALIPVLMDLGRASGGYGKAGKQKRYFNRALKLADKHYGKKSTRYGQLSVDAGISILELSQSRDARLYLENGYEILLTELSSSHPLTGRAAFHLGKYELVAKDYDAAEKLLTAALGTFETPGEPSNQMEMTTHAFLVEVYEETGHSEKATDHCLAIGRMTPVDETQDYMPLFKRVPTYPANALRRGLEGQVIVEFTVDHEGIVRDPRVLDTGGRRGFEDAAIEAVKDFRYAPRFIDGQPTVTSNVRHKLTFKIAD